jgi:hypothetical protein
MSVDQFQIFSFSNFIKFIKLNANKQITQVPIRSLEDLGWMLKIHETLLSAPLSRIRFLKITTPDQSRFNCILRIRNKHNTPA